MAVAVTRHGLYAIDRLFNRTLVYAVADRAAGRRRTRWWRCSPGCSRAAPRSRPRWPRWPRRSRSGRCATACSALVDRRFARARFEAVRLLREFLDDVRDGRAEPEDVGAVVALALDDPGAEMRLPAAGDERLRRPPRAPASTCRDGRERSPIVRRDLGSACCCTPRRRPTCCAAVLSGGRRAGRARPAAGGAAAAARRGGVLARADRPGRLRRAAADRARPARRRAAAPRHARDRAAAAAALAAARGAHARARARRRRGRGGGRDRRPAHARRRRAPAAARRGARGRAGRPGARRHGARRGRRHGGPGAAGRRGGRLLRGLRGADQRGQARVAPRACASRRRAPTGACGC